MMNKFTYVFILFLIPFISAGTLDMQFVDLTTMSGVADVDVAVYDYETNLLLFNFETDSNGDLSIEDLEGEYVLRATREGYSNVKLTQVMGDSDYDLGEVFIMPLSTINVDVSNSSEPLNNAIVTIQENSDKVTAVFEGSTGEFEVTAGSYTLFIYAENHIQKSVPLNVGPGETVDVSYVLEYSNETLLPSVVNVVVDLDETSVNAGDEVKFTAKAIYNNGMEHDVTSGAEWNFGDVGFVYDNEIVTQKLGDYTISATYLGRTGSESLIVSNGEVESLSVVASKNTILRNEKSILSYYLTDIYSNEFETEEELNIY